jgi:hypothetical protein
MFENGAGFLNDQTEATKVDNMQLGRETIPRQYRAWNESKSVQKQIVTGGKKTRLGEKGSRTKARSRNQHTYQRLLYHLKAKK